MNKAIPKDGKIHRFNGLSKGSGWGISFGDYTIIGDWVDHSKEVIRDGELLSPDARKAVMRQYKADRQKQERKAAQECAEFYANAAEFGSHPYLEKKKVDNFAGKIDDGIFYIPLHDMHGQIWSLQRINANGDKYFYTGGKTKGLFFILGEDLNRPIVICEGYSTGASIQMACPDLCVVVAFNAGNLEPVVGIFCIAGFTPIVAADNDKWKPHAGNAGIQAANMCELYWKTRYVAPVFLNESAKPTDFNDLHCLEGLGAVHDQIMSIFNKE